MKAIGLRWADAFRLALHNLWHNKSRTVLTVIIVTVISSLIMIICIIGISFLKNMTNGSKQVFEASGTEYVFNSRILSDSYWNFEREPISSEDRTTFDAIAEKYSSVYDRKEYVVSLPTKNGVPQAGIRWHCNLPEAACTSAEAYEDWFRSAYPGENGFDGSKSDLELNDLTIADLSHYSFGGTERSSQGRLWSEEDNAQPVVWVGSKYAADQASKGVTISPGDTVTFVFVRKFFYGSLQEYRFYTCTVAGIFDSESTRVPAEWGGQTAAKKIIAGKDFLTEYANEIELTGIELCYRPPQTGYDYWAIHGQMQAFTDEVNGQFPPYTTESGEHIRFSCTYLELMDTADLLNLVVIAVLTGISVLILLLSIGSIVNTILISVDKNRRFLGLMKALGMTQKDVRRMTSVEMLLMIVAGVVLSVALLYALQGAILSLMKSMFSAMFSELPLELSIGIWIPFYLPIITAAAFFAFTFLFSRRSVRKFAGRNVIGMVSEVV